VNTDFSTITSMFQANSSLFEKATHGIPDGQWLTQPCTDSNHLLFIAGHVVVHRAFVPKYLGVECSAPWARLFCARCEEGERVAPGQYPSVAEIQRAWKEASEKLTAALPNAAAEVLSQQVPKERPSLDGTVGGAIGLLCFHESYHLGQVN
jgi:hypothetical protein